MSTTKIEEPKEEIIWPRRGQVWVDCDDAVHFVTSRSGLSGKTIHWVAMTEPLRPDFGEMSLREWMQTMVYVHDDMDAWFESL